MIARRLRPIIEERLRQMPGVVLLGPRQVGKTTLARQIANLRKARAIYLDLERPTDQRRLQDTDAFLRATTDGRLPGTASQEQLDSRAFRVSAHRATARMSPCEPALNLQMFTPRKPLRLSRPSCGGERLE